MAQPSRGDVLVVDDEESIRIYLQMLLEDEGYATQTVADGELAWAKILASHRPFIIISDYWMPHLDGAGLFTRLLEHPDLARHQRFILITAAGRELPTPFAAQLRTAGAPVLRKPFIDLDVILDAVREVQPLNVD